MKMHIKKYWKESLYRNSIVLMLNYAISALFGLLFWIVVARTMPSEDVGLATASLSAATLIVALSTLGLDQGLIRYLPGLKEKSGFYSAVIVLTVVLALIITGIFLIGIPFFSPVLSFLREGWFLPIFLILIIAMSVYSIQSETFIAIRRADLCVIQGLLLGVRIPMVVFLAPFGILGMFSAYGIAFLLTLVLSIFILHRYGLSITRSFDITSIRETLKFSLGNYSASIFRMAPVTIIPIIIVNTIGAEEGAHFYIAYSIASLIFVIPNSVSTSLFVEGSHNVPIKKNALKSFQIVFAFLVPALIILFLLGNKVFLLFGKEYSEQSFEMFQLLAASSIFLSVISIFISIKKIQRDVGTINYVNFALSLVTIGSGYVALLKYGLLGLGYAWLGANMMVSAVILGVMIFKEKWV